MCEHALAEHGLSQITPTNSLPSGEARVKKKKKKKKKKARVVWFSTQPHVAT